MIRIGFEVGTGEPVEIEIGHMVVCGQTQKSGKTTLLEAAATRAGRPVIAFRTKRGEGAFEAGARLPAYFEERADWQFVESILESTMRQRMKFERAWIMRACRGARTLADVAKNVKALQDKATRGMDRDMYMMLAEYLSIVVPILARLPRAARAAIRTGVNVVDLVELPQEVQGLVVGSWLARVHREERNVVCVIPESWKFLPQGRNSPVKMAATSIAREGAGLGNFLWMDAQDLAGLEKEHQRGASVWCLGVQREMNEVKRNLALLPAGMKKPKAEDVASLRLGQFWVCQPEGIAKAYVWPAWMTEDEARAVSRGTVAIADIKRVARQAAEMVAILRKTPRVIETEPEEEEMPSEAIEALMKLTETVDRMIAKIDAVLDDRGKPVKFDLKFDDVDPERTSRSLGKALAPIRAWDDENALFARFRARLLKDPAVLRVLALEKRIEVSVETDVVEVDGKTLGGRVALLLLGGWFDEDRSANAVWIEVKRGGYPSSSKWNPAIITELNKLAESGFLTREGKNYLAAPGAKKRVKAAS